MSNGYCTLYIARHGETSWNVKNKIQGQTDIPLNRTGKLQAKVLGNELKHIQFAAVFSSDLQRAQKTAEIAVLEKDMLVQTSILLREKTFGKLEGIEREKLLALQALRKDLTKEQQLVHRLVPDMENDEEVISRVIRFLRETALAYPGENVLVVSHGAVMYVLLAHLGVAHVKKIGNTAYIVLRCDGVDFFVDKTQNIEFED